MNPGGDLPAEGAEELFESAPCGYLTTALDGTILKVNRTFEAWTGLNRAELLGKKRFQDLLGAGGRIYHETHYSPMLRMQGEVREIAFEIERADGSCLPALVNSLLDDPGDGPQIIRTTVFDASERRRYEQELLRAQQREHEIARQLQRSLLAGALPVASGLEVVASYRPAAGRLEVGGDWYDAFWLDEDRVGLVVGDVVGRGIAAAATMGQLRSATRALASTNLQPGRLLEALDAYARRHDVGLMATVVYAELHLRSLELRFGCAGHLPPVLVSGGATRLLWEGRSRPLAGYGKERRRRPEASCQLTSESLLVLYTDGLVERRDRGIDIGLEHLVGQVRTLEREAGSSLSATLLHGLDDSDHSDDVCLLAAVIGDCFT